MLYARMSQFDELVNEIKAENAERMRVRMEEDAKETEERKREYVRRNYEWKEFRGDEDDVVMLRVRRVRH